MIFQAKPWLWNGPDLEGKVSIPKHGIDLTLFEMGFFELSVKVGGGGKEEGGTMTPHHTFVDIAQIITKLGTSMKLDVFYTMATKKLWRHHYYVLWCHNLYISRWAGLNFKHL